MKRATWIAIGALWLCGCAASDRGALLRAGGAGRTANLALGPTAEHGRVAQLFTYRSAWPSVSTGFRFDETSYVTEVLFDDQAFYDRNGGSFYRSAAAVRTSVFLR